VENNNAGASSSALANKLLSSLAPDHFQMLAAHMASEFFEQGAILAEAGDEVDFVYFPHNGMLSLLSVFNDGSAVETAMVGREGVVGAMAGLGLYRSRVRVVVQLALEVTKIPASRFRTAVAQADAIRNLCTDYNEILLSQARITAACNAVHLIEARFCRWLLQTADRAGSDTINLTQEFLAEMLGVRRTSVTEVATKVQAAGVIRYARGVINILDRAALEKMSCECYSTLLDQSVAFR
jgi:CRP-like cAMP-binding protein